MKTLATLCAILAVGASTATYSVDSLYSLSTTVTAVSEYVQRHKELYPSMRTQTRNGELMWTKDEIIRFVEYRTKYLYQETDC